MSKALKLLSLLEKFKASDIKFSEESLGGEKYLIAAYDKKTSDYLGHVKYSEYKGEVRIMFIEVDDKYRRQGIAKFLVLKLAAQESIRYSDIIWGIQTKEGSKLKAYLDKLLK